MGELRSAVDALAALDLDDLDNTTLGDLIVEISRQHDRLDGIRHRLVGEHDRRLAWKADGARSEKQWLADRCRMSPGEASARANTARNLDRLPETAQALAKGLREETYAVDVVENGERAVYQAAITDYDAIILDVVLPLRDGLAVCQAIRQEGSAVPILMLTARDAVEARIAGLDSGADDYLTKPFDLRELLARLRAIIRRGHRPPTPSILRVGPLELDTRARRGFRGGRPLTLTAREYALLEHLVLHANEVVGRAALAEHVWDAPFETMSNVIDVCIQRLRRKIDEPGRPSFIVTRRGEGYMLFADRDSRGADS